MRVQVAAGMQRASRPPDIIRHPVGPRCLARMSVQSPSAHDRWESLVRRHPALGSERPEVRAVGALWLELGVDPEGVWLVCV